MEIGTEILQGFSFREDCKGWLEKIAIYIGKVWVDPLPFIAFATINIYFCVFMWLQMCRIFMWMNSKCNQKMVFTIIYLCIYKNNTLYTNVVFQALTNTFISIILL